jgi:acetyl esterase
MRRSILWAAGILLVLIVTVVLAFKFSPWPAIAIINYAFSKGDRAYEAALAKHVPGGIVSRHDIAYGDGKDEVLDLYYQQGAKPQPSSGYMAADLSKAARMGSRIT